MSHTTISDQDTGLLSFYRLIGCLYFKYSSLELQNPTTPVALFKHILGRNNTSTMAEIHIKWLNAIMNTARVRTSGGKKNVMPSETA